MAQKLNKSYPIEALKKSTEFSGYADLISALFISRSSATKEEVREAIQNYLNKEVQ